MSDLRKQFLWYMAGVTSFVIPIGIQTILFPWLIAVQLHESADRLGIAQMSTQLPGLFLILFGGLLADRIDQRKILVVFHLLAAIPAAGLALVLYLDLLSYGILIVYALLMGTVGAFIQPARDGMLNRVAGDQLQRTVTVTMGLTFGAQIFGFAAASFADTVGAIPLLLLQSLIILSGALISLMLSPAPPIPQEKKRGTRLSQIKGGLDLVIHSPRMGPALVMMMAMSMFFGGSFVVLNPIIVRDVYHGSASDISMSFGAFMVGTIATTILLVSLGGVSKQGRALMLAIFAGGICLLVAATGLPFYGYLMALFLWGICGGVAMSMGRTIMQESAPLEYRARVMSVFSLGSVGGMPVGALLIGFCAATVGPLMTLPIAVAGIWTVLALLWWKSDLADLEPLPLVDQMQTLDEQSLAGTNSE
jgi:MFS family permease